MKTITDSTGRQYKVSEHGTAFHIDTDNEICRILDEAIQSKKRLKIYLGDTKTGRDWNEEYNTTGRIGRSTGTIKIPLMIHSSRSYGGAAILDYCIVKIKDIATGRTLFHVPNYYNGEFKIVPCNHLTTDYTHSVMINDRLYSNHKSLRSAKLLVSKLA
jgi:hypothetical protein